MTLVIDASITVAWFFADEQISVTENVLRRVGMEGAIVPSLWRLEVASAFGAAVRRKRCDEVYAGQSLHRLEKLPITVDHETDDHAWGATRELSLKQNLTVYDSAYLELAMRRGAVLATRDTDLAAAAKRVGLEVIFD